MSQNTEGNACTAYSILHCSLCIDSVHGCMRKSKLLVQAYKLQQNVTIAGHGLNMTIGINMTNTN
jgi:hypothetical protein